MAKAFILNAFALTERFDIVPSNTQGAALGYEIIGLSARPCTGNRWLILLR